MPAVPITSREQYIKAIEVLDRVGGTYQGVGHDKWFLLVTQAQHEALVEAKVVTPKHAAAKGPKRGKNSLKNARP